MSETNKTPKTSTTQTAAAPVAPAPAAVLKKGPSPVFSIPATQADKNFIKLQSERTGKPQKELLAMAIHGARKSIEALPKYVEPAPTVAVKVQKATEAEAALKAAPVAA